MEHIVRVLEKHYDRKNVDMFMRNYELNKKVGVDKNPYDAPAKKSVPGAQPDAALTRRMQRLEKISYAGFAGIAGFLSASALAVLIAALWR
jgi:ABC-type arginine transport system ATPase subunit